MTTVALGLALIWVPTLSFVAYAQATCIPVREVDVNVNGAVVLILPDAGCKIQPIARVTVNGVQVHPTSRPYNGARCASLAAAAAKAAFLDVGVGDGGRP